MYTAVILRGMNRQKITGRVFSAMVRYGSNVILKAVPIKYLFFPVKNGNA